MNTKSLLTRIGVPVLSLAMLGGLGATLATSASAATTNSGNGVTAVTHSAQHIDTTSVSGPATGTSDNGPTWAVDNLSEHFTVVPASGLADGANYQVTIDVTGSFKGFADPTTGGYLTSSGPVKGTITYDVLSSTPPDPATLLPNQAPQTGLRAALSQLFDNQPTDGSMSIIKGGGNDYSFSYQNGNYVQDNVAPYAHGDVTGH